MPISEASVIGQDGFSGAEYLVTWEGVSASGSSISYQHTNAVNEITLRDTNLEVISGAGYLFDNIAGASLGSSVRDSNGDAFLALDLPEFTRIPPPIEGVNRVGGLLSADGDPSTQWLITTYDLLGNPLESATFSQPVVGDAVFFGFESSVRMGRVTIDKIAGSAGYYTFIDDIRWESASVIPVPAAVWLFGTGLLGIIGYSKRKK